ncbi:MAG: translation initiation factor IF-2 [Pseudomonadota bacterium]
MSEDKKLTVSGRKTLGVRTTVETGKVRQSFSHGRSKAVVVERKRKRVLKRGDEAETPPSEAVEAEAVAEVEVAAPPPPPSDHLTAGEREARAEAVMEALKQAEEERRRAAEEARRRAEQEKLEVAERERQAREAKRQSEEEEARRQKEAPPPPVAAEPFQKEVETRKPAAPAHRPREEAGDDEEEGGRKRPGGKRKLDAAPKPSRRQEERRRGKLTVSRALGDEDEMRVRSLASLRRAREKQKAAHKVDGTAPKRAREVVVPETITVQELANRMAEKSVDVIKSLMKMGVMATINQTLDQDTAELVVSEFGHQIKRVSAADVEIGLIGEEDKAENLKPRPPVVTVMGHVDHGKTSLLDAIRSSDVAAGEAGGITQHIGAYQVTLGTGEKVTFLDTPGHEAFTSMRARGASVTDIVVLVVAADDGIMPQTVEAINHAKAAGVPIIVAINKIDKPGANPDKVRQALLQHEVIVEALSGDTLDVEVSALKRTNIDKLLEAIHLQAEVLELAANPDRAAEGTIIEAELDKGRGPVATVLVRRGTLKVGDIFVAGAEWGKVRALIDDHGTQIAEAGPSRPVEVLGLSGTPSAGDDFAVVENEARAREVSSYRQGLARRHRQAAPTSLEKLFSQMKEAKAEEYPVVIKGDVQGSVEAITAALAKLGTDEIKVRVLHAAVGGITESDVALAKASGAAIIGFNVRANRQAREMAEAEGVPLKYYAIIYELVDDVRAAMAGQLGPEVVETVIGTAEVREVFSAGKTGKAAGCRVTEGAIRRAEKARILRDGVIVYTGKITNLRRFKDDVEEVRNGLECGMTFENFSDIKPGDEVQVFSEETRERVL